jgi:hypothetical protein
MQISRLDLATESEIDHRGHRVSQRKTQRVLHPSVGFSVYLCALCGLALDLVGVSPTAAQRFL